MKNTINKNYFTDWFHRERPNNFSQKGAEALFEYLEEYEESTGEEIEFDPIAICCEYSEYENLNEFHCSYDDEDYPDLDKIREHTQVIEVGSESFIIQDF